MKQHLHRLMSSILLSREQTFAKRMEGMAGLSNGHLNFAGVNILCASALQGNENASTEKLPQVLIVLLVLNINENEFVLQGSHTQ